jgi:hypothetical protein
MKGKDIHEKMIPDTKDDCKRQYEEKKGKEERGKRYEG